MVLCFVHCQGQKREQKHTTKNFVEFHNHSPPLSMVSVFSCFALVVKSKYIDTLMFYFLLLQVHNVFLLIANIYQ